MVTWRESPRYSVMYITQEDRVIEAPGEVRGWVMTPRRRRYNRRKMHYAFVSLLLSGGIHEAV